MEDFGMTFDREIIMQIILALGGLGLFLYGMRLMGEGLELAAGANLRNLLEKLTTNKAAIASTLNTFFIFLNFFGLINYCF